MSTLALKLATPCGPKIAINCGRMHEYLCTEMDFDTDPDKVILSMIKCLQKII